MAVNDFLTLCYYDFLSLKLVALLTFTIFCLGKGNKGECSIKDLIFNQGSPSFTSKEVFNFLEK